MRSLTSLRAIRGIRTASLLRPISLASRQSIHTTAPACSYKDDQDREALQPKAPYGSQSPGDEAATQNPDSYSRNKTDPSKEKKDEPNELEVSGANQELSKPQGDDAHKESRPTKSDDRKASSGGKTSAGKKGKPS
jgi:hypothetical protein